MATIRMIVNFSTFCCILSTMLSFVKRSITRKNVVQFLQYMVGGGLYFWSGYAIFALCYSGLHWNWLYAKIAADIVGWTLNYLVQRYWTFAATTPAHHEGKIIGRYGLITLCNLGLDYLIIAGLNAVGVSPYVGFFISAGFFTIWNFVWYRFWVFVGNARKSSIKGGT